MGDLADYVTEQAVKADAAAANQSSGTADSGEHKGPVSADAVQSGVDLVLPTTVGVEEGEKQSGEEGTPGQAPPEEGKKEEGATVAPKSEPSPEDQLHEITIDGKKEKLALKDLKSRVQKSEASERRMHEAHELKTQYEGKEAQLKEREDMVNRSMEQLFRDPLGTLERLLVGRLGDHGLAKEVLRRRTSDWLAGELEYEQLPQEQKRALEETRKLELDRRRLKEEREQLDREKFESNRNAANKAVDEAFKSALKEAGLPDVQGVRSRLHEQLLKLPMPQTVAELNERAKQAAALLKAEDAKVLVSDSLKLLQELPPERLSELMPGFLDKMRAFDLERLKRQKTQRTTATATGAASNGSTNTSRRGQVPKNVTGPEFRDFLETRLR